MSVQKLLNHIKDISIYQGYDLSFALTQIEVYAKDDNITSLTIDGGITKNKGERLNDSTISLIFRELLQLLKHGDSKNTFISKLETIDMRNNDIEFNTDQHNYFYDFLRYCSDSHINIKNINFQNNLLCDSHIDELLSICADLPSIQSINLSYNINMGRQGASLVSKYMTMVSKVPNNKLRSLYLNNCGFDLTSMIGLIVSLSPFQDNSSSSNYLRLETLELNRPVVDKVPQEEFIEHLSRLIANNHKEKTSVANTLMSLSLKYCCISNWGIERLIDSLNMNPLNNIRSLSLDGNAINNVGAVILANYLKSHTQNGIEYLGLSLNLIGDDGCAAIAKSMEKNKTLKTLALGNCRLNSSLVQLAESLQVNCSLRTLYLWGNTFNQTACKAFHQLFDDHNHDCHGTNNSVSGYIVSDKLTTDFELYVVDEIYHVAQVTVTVKEPI